MEWKVLSILVFVLGPLLNPTEEKPIISEVRSAAIKVAKRFRRASAASCGEDQTFLCANLTHYSPCTRVSKNNNVSDAQNLQKCGFGRCCQPGAASPCAYDCSFGSSEFLRSRIQSSFSKKNLPKMKRTFLKTVNSEDVEDENKIVSIKNFVVREKNTMGGMKWKPSYKNFCKISTTSVAPTDNENSTSTTAITSDVTLETTTETTTARKSITTSTKSTTTTKKATINTTTTKKATTTTTTKKPSIKTTKPKRTKKPSKSRWVCRKSDLKKKMPITFSCTDYKVCEKAGTGYRWRLYTCKMNFYFDPFWNICRHKKHVDCNPDIIPEWYKNIDMARRKLNRRRSITTHKGKRRMK